MFHFHGVHDLQILIISRSHHGTDGMKGYQRAYGRPRMPRRYVPWSGKVFYLEQSKRKSKSRRSGRGDFPRNQDESEIAVVGTPQGIVFASGIRRVPKRGFWRWFAVQQHQKSPVGTAT